MTKRSIQITEDVILRSQRANSGHCMIADAIHSNIPGSTRVSVDLQTMRYTLGDERFCYFTPKIAQQALIRFDQGDAIEPFGFALGRPVQVIKRRTQSTRSLSAARKLQSAKGGKRAQQKARLARAASAKKGTTRLGGTLPPTFAVQSNLGNRRIFGLKAARA